MRNVMVCCIFSFLIFGLFHSIKAQGQHAFHWPDPQILADEWQPFIPNFAPPQNRPISGFPKTDSVRQYFGKTEPLLQQNPGIPLLKKSFQASVANSIDPYTPSPTLGSYNPHGVPTVQTRNPILENNVKDGAHFLEQSAHVHGKFHQQIPPVHRLPAYLSHPQLTNIQYHPQQQHQLQQRQQQQQQQQQQPQPQLQQPLFQPQFFQSANQFLTRHENSVRQLPLPIQTPSRVATTSVQVFPPNQYESNTYFLGAPPQKENLLEGQKHGRKQMRPEEFLLSNTGAKEERPGIYNNDESVPTRSIALTAFNGLTPALLQQNPTPFSPRPNYDRNHFLQDNLKTFHPELSPSSSKFHEPHNVKHVTEPNISIYDDISLSTNPSRQVFEQLSHFGRPFSLPKESNSQDFSNMKATAGTNAYNSKLQQPSIASSYRKKDKTKSNRYSPKGTNVNKSTSDVDIGHQKSPTKNSHSSGTIISSIQPSSVDYEPEKLQAIKTLTYIPQDDIIHFNEEDVKIFQYPSKQQQNYFHNKGEKYPSIKNAFLPTPTELNDEIDAATFDPINDKKFVIQPQSTTETVTRLASNHKYSHVRNNADDNDVDVRGNRHQYSQHQHQNHQQQYQEQQPQDSLRDEFTSGYLSYTSGGVPDHQSFDATTVSTNDNQDTSFHAERTSTTMTMPRKSNTRRRKPSKATNKNPSQRNVTTTKDNGSIVNIGTEFSDDEGNGGGYYRYRPSASKEYESIGSVNSIDASFIESTSHSVGYTSNKKKLLKLTTSTTPTTPTTATTTTSSEDEYPNYPNYPNYANLHQHSSSNWYNNVEEHKVSASSASADDADYTNTEKNESELNYPSLKIRPKLRSTLSSNSSSTLTTISNFDAKTENTNVGDGTTENPSQKFRIKSKHGGGSVNTNRNTNTSSAGHGSSNANVTRPRFSIKEYRRTSTVSAPVSSNTTSHTSSENVHSGDNAITLLLEKKKNRKQLFAMRAKQKGDTTSTTTNSSTALLETGNDNGNDGEPSSTRKYKPRIRPSKYNNVSLQSTITDVATEVTTSTRPNTSRPLSTGIESSYRNRSNTSKYHNRYRTTTENANKLADGRDGDSDSDNSDNQNEDSGYGKTNIHNGGDSDSASSDKKPTRLSPALFSAKRPSVLYSRSRPSTSTTNTIITEELDYDSDEEEESEKDIVSNSANVASVERLKDKNADTVLTKKSSSRYRQTTLPATAASAPKIAEKADVDISQTSIMTSSEEHDEKNNRENNASYNKMEQTVNLTDEDSHDEISFQNDDNNEDGNQNTHHQFRKNEVNKVYDEDIRENDNDDHDDSDDDNDDNTGSNINYGRNNDDNNDNYTFKINNNKDSNKHKISLSGMAESGAEVKSEAIVEEGKATLTSTMKVAEEFKEKPLSDTKKYINEYEKKETNEEDDEGDRVSKVSLLTSQSGPPTRVGLYQQWRPPVLTFGRLTTFKRTSD